MECRQNSVVMASSPLQYNRWKNYLSRASASYWGICDCSILPEKQNTFYEIFFLPVAGLSKWKGHIKPEGQIVSSGGPTGSKAGFLL